LKPWVITVLVVIVIVWGVAANVVSAYTEVLALVTALYAGSAVQQRSTAIAGHAVAARQHQPPTV
jgi:hypothetical protein